jgi:hypothetical protein
MEVLVTNINTINGEVFRFTSANVNGNDVYIGTVDRGMIRLDRNNTSSTEFIADGPTRNRAFQFQHRLMSFGWLR